MLSISLPSNAAALPPSTSPREHSGKHNLETVQIHFRGSGPTRVHKTLMETIRGDLLMGIRVGLTVRGDIPALDSKITLYLPTPFSPSHASLLRNPAKLPPDFHLKLNLGSAKNFQRRACQTLNYRTCPRHPTNSNTKYIFVSEQYTTANSAVSRAWFEKRRSRVARLIFALGDSPRGSQASGNTARPNFWACPEIYKYRATHLPLFIPTTTTFRPTSSSHYILPILEHARRPRCPRSSLVLWALCLVTAALTPLAAAIAVVKTSSTSTLQASTIDSILQPDLLQNFATCFESRTRGFSRLPDSGTGFVGASFKPLKLWFEFEGFSRLEVVLVYSRQSLDVFAWLHRSSRARFKALAVLGPSTPRYCASSFACWIFMNLEDSVNSGLGFEVFNLHLDYSLRVFGTFTSLIHRAELGWDCGRVELEFKRGLTSDLWILSDAPVLQVKQLTRDSTRESVILGNIYIPTVGDHYHYYQGTQFDQRVNQTGLNLAPDSTMQTHPLDLSSTLRDSHEDHALNGLCTECGFDLVQFRCGLGSKSLWRTIPVWTPCVRAQFCALRERKGRGARFPSSWRGNGGARQLEGVRRWVTSRADHSGVLNARTRPPKCNSAPFQPSRIDVGDFTCSGLGKRAATTRVACRLASADTAGRKVQTGGGVDSSASGNEYVWEPSMVWWMWVSGSEGQSVTCGVGTRSYAGVCGGPRVTMRYMGPHCAIFDSRGISPQKSGPGESRNEGDEQNTELRTDLPAAASAFPSANPNFWFFSLKLFSIRFFNAIAKTIANNVHLVSGILHLPMCCELFIAKSSRRKFFQVARWRCFPRAAVEREGASALPRDTQPKTKKNENGHANVDKGVAERTFERRGMWKCCFPRVAVERESAFESALPQDTQPKTMKRDYAEAKEDPALRVHLQEVIDVGPKLGAFGLQQWVDQDSSVLKHVTASWWHKRIRFFPLVAMSANTLPPELWENILDFIKLDHPEDLQACALVSRSMAILAQPLHFEDVYLSSIPIHPRGSRRFIHRSVHADARSLRATLTAEPHGPQSHLAGLIRRIRVPFCMGAMTPLRGFVFPRLQEIEFYPCSDHPIGAPNGRAPYCDGTKA
ncbi:hypothetical protein C8R43DRAFT_956514 [Mycena crocata]|nr:hypothetical protein C8R43DRAFT_956514 [Mycena crocata]